MKRTFDLVLSTIGLVLALPLMSVIAIVIKITSPGPVLYLGIRIGLNGRPFRMAKFRSMRIGAEREGSSITTQGDDRVTPIGRYLRLYKIDELPQLYNILIGDMSFVGPRPETPDWVEMYTEAQKRVLSVRPGITDPAQIIFRHEEYYLETDRHYLSLMQYKLAKQLDYVNNHSFLGDLGVLWGTVAAIFQEKPGDEALEVYQRIGKDNNQNRFTEHDR